MRTIDIIKEIARGGGHPLNKLQWSIALLTGLRLVKILNTMAVIP